MKNNLLIIIITAILSGGIGFWGARAYQKNQKISATPGQLQFGKGMQNGTGHGGNNMTRGGKMPGNGGGPVSGEISSLEDKTITLKTQDGSSKIIVFSDSSIINKISEASLADLQVGSQIMVMGTSDDSGTLTAKTISIGKLPIFGRPIEDTASENLIAPTK